MVTVCALMGAGQAWAADTDCTDKVGTATVNWTGATGTYTPKTLNVQMVERYSDGLTAVGTTVFTQTVTGLSAGTYNVVLYATANNARNNDGIKSDAQDLVYVYAGSDKEHKAYVMSHYQDAVVMPHIYALNNVSVGDDGELEIGMYVEKSGTQWQTIQIKSFTKVDVAAQPNVTKKVTVGGSAVSNTDAFTSIAATSTLEVDATACIPIYFTNATEAFTYTPESTCTVRFVRTGGSIYVYEGTTYKGTVSTFTPTLFTTFAANYKPTNSSQLLQNPDFELGSEVSSGIYNFGTPWTTNATIKSGGIRCQYNGSKTVALWRGTKNNNYFGQPLTTLKPNTKYQVMLEQVDNGNANATFYIGIGSTAGTHGLCETSVTLGTSQNGVKTLSFTTPASIVNGTTYYFTFQNTVSYNSASSGSDPVTQIDWISLEEPYSWGLTGISSASYLDGTAYIPYTLEEIRSLFDEVYASINTNLNDATYSNVVGTERTNLETAYNTTYKSYTSGDVTDYETEISNINSLIETFTAAKTNYDANAAEVTKATALGVSSSTISKYTAGSTTTAATALTNTQNLKVAEYDYVTGTYSYGVDLGAWTTTGPTGSLSAQHYKGSGNSYLEQSSAAWGQSSWTIKYDQDVTLPAGNYVFKVAGRQAASDGVTLSLTVKNGESILGTVNDFPRGDTGLGINTSGVTDFTTGEGHTYANGGAGRGWEWRYVKFTLDDDATVNVAVDAVATTNHMWVSFCDASVLTDNEANISLIAYNIAYNNAVLARDNSTYANVKGQERAGLLAAIADDTSLDKTNATAIDAAKEILESATTTFTADATVTAWNRLAASIETADDISASHTDATTAWNSSTTEASDATSAANNLYQDLLTDVLPAVYTAGFENGEYAPYITAAVLAFYTTGSVDADKVAAGTTDVLHSAITNCIANDGSVNAISNSGNFGKTLSSIGWATNGQWVGEESNYVCVTNASTISYGSTEGFEMPLKANTVYELKFRHAGWDSSNEDNGGTVSVLNASSEGLSATDFAGNNGKYKGDDATYRDESFLFKTGAAGNYVLTVASKGARTTVKGFSIKKVPAASVTVTDAGFATFCHTYPLDFSASSIKAYKVKVSDKGVATLTQVDEVPANTPVLLHKAGGATENIPVIASASAVSDNDLVAGTGANVPTYETVSTTDDYTNMILNNVSGIGFYYANNQIVATNRAYLHIATGLAPDRETGSRMVMVFADETTGISSHTPSLSPKGEGSVYTLGGQRVETPKKGLYIKNGKKVIIK